MKLSMCSLDNCPRNCTAQSTVDQFVILQLTIIRLQHFRKPRIQACDTRLFPCERVGSGYETSITEGLRMAKLQLTSCSMK